MNVPLPDLVERVQTMPQTITKRTEVIRSARRDLGVYKQYTNTLDDDRADCRRVRRMALLRAQAAIERALYLETGGTHGDLWATPRKMWERSERSQP